MFCFVRCLGAERRDFNVLNFLSECQYRQVGMPPSFDWLKFGGPHHLGYHREAQQKKIYLKKKTAHPIIGRSRLWIPTGRALWVGGAYCPFMLIRETLANHGCPWGRVHERGQIALIRMRCCLYMSRRNTGWQMSKLGENGIDRMTTKVYCNLSSSVMGNQRWK